MSSEIRGSLIVKIHKDSSCLKTSRMRTPIPKLQSIYLGRLFQSQNSAKKYYGKIILEANSCREEIDITEESEMDRKGFIQLSTKKHHK